MSRTLHLAALVWLALAALAGRASAACELVAVQSISLSAFDAGTYTATLVPPPTTVTLSVTMLVNGHGGGCKGEYGLLRPTAPARMARVPAGPVTLPYGVTSGGAPILSFGTAATARQRMPNIHVRNGETTTTVALSFTVMPQAVIGSPPVGGYADQLNLQLFDVQGSRSRLIGQLPIAVVAQVVNSCTLVAPGGLSMNFSSDVSTGIPRGAPQSLAFSVNCTGPARLQLSGSALTAPVAASGVFDNFVNYRATASFGGINATLTTNGAVPVLATSSSQSTTFGSNLPVAVNVNLIAGRPLIGSTTYTGVLRVTVDPAL